MEVVERTRSGLLVVRRKLSRAIYPDEYLPIRPWYEMRDRILDVDGTPLTDWSDPVGNALADEGESVILNSIHRAVAVPTQYLAILSATPTDTTTMATMTESETPGSNGYSRQQLTVGTTDWPNAPALNSGDMQITALAKTFTNSGVGTWTVTYAALVTTATGTAGLFLMYVATAASRAISPGLSYQVTLSSKMQ